MIMYHKFYQLSLLIFLMTVSVRSSYVYCDRNIGICLNRPDERARSWEDAQNRCSNNGSILLEIYNDAYKQVTLKAFSSWNHNINGLYIIFGLTYINGAYKWLSTGSNVDLSLFAMERFTGSCKSFLVWSLIEYNKLQVHPSCDGRSPDHYFVCLKDNNSLRSIPQTQQTTSKALGLTSFPTTPNLSISITNQSITLSTRSPDLVSQPTQSMENRGGEDERRKIGIGVGVGLAGVLITVVVLAVVICLVKRRRPKQIPKPHPITSTSSRSELQTPELSNRPDEGTLNYAELDFSDVQRENEEFDNIYG